MVIPTGDFQNYTGKAMASGQSISARALKFNRVAATQGAHSMCNEPVQHFVMDVIRIHIFQYFSIFRLSHVTLSRKTIVSKDIIGMILN